MKILIISDIHTEFHRDSGVAFVRSLPGASEVDVCVVAGDLSDSKGIERALRLLCQAFKDVVFVCGNHEYYMSGIQDVRVSIKELADENGRSNGRMGNLHFLDNSTCEINDQRFIGATMWFRHYEGIRHGHGLLSDFKMIRDADTEIYDENIKSVEFLSNNVLSSDIVVTHHLPSEASVSKRFKGSPLNCFFVCDMEGLIMDRRPKLWVHGHTHDSVDCHVGATRIVCNPYGYHGYQVNPEFVDKIVIV